MSVVTERQRADSIGKEKYEKIEEEEKLEEEEEEENEERTTKNNDDIKFLESVSPKVVESSKNHTVNVVNRITSNFDSVDSFKNNDIKMNRVINYANCLKFSVESIING